MAAAPAASSQAEQLLAHTVYYSTSTCAIKEDIAQLAGCWKSGSGPLTKQEAGLLLWYHSQRGEDGRAEVLDSGVLATCFDCLNSSTALPADKSTAAGLLLSLSADDKGKEQVARGKASGATGSGCCQVLHGCLSNPAAVPRHVTALLAALASCPTSLAVLVKALAGSIPSATYTALLQHSHTASKDHATAIDVCKIIQQMVKGREALACDAAAAGVLEALLAATAAHKSAAAVAAGANCLLALCLAAPNLRERLGQVQGAIQKIVDLLGPPPATMIAWEQQQLKPATVPSPRLQSAAAAAAESDPQQPLGRGPHHTTSSIRVGASSTGYSASSTGYGGNSSSSQHVRISENRTDSPKGRSRSGALGVLEGMQQMDLEGTAASISSKDAAAEEQPASLTATRTRRKSLRILSVAEVDAAMPGGSSTGSAPSSTADATSPTHRSKSLLGCMKQNSIASCSKTASNTPASPALCSPPLSTNSTALKWEAPVPDATRAAAAGLLAQLVQLPAWRVLACDRLATPRLAVLLNTTMQKLADAPGKKGKPGKKGSKLTLTPEVEQLLTHTCVCLEFLVAADNADCYRVAAAGCLPGLVMLASEARNTQLRRAAKAVVAQVMILDEAQQYVQQAEVPQDLTASTCTEGTQVRLRLKDAEMRHLMVEIPGGFSLHTLDDVTARARHVALCPDHPGRVLWVWDAPSLV